MSHLSARRQRRVAAIDTGLLLTAGLLVPAASAEVADLPDGVPSNELLLPHALDDRVADYGVTQIAVRATDAAGDEIVYGARPSTTPLVADLEAAVAGTRYFVDCSAPEPGTGARDSPFADLEAINAVELEPGDQVLFRRGATCTSMFQPQGTGTAENPVVIDAYDAEADAMDRIDAAGEPQAVYLYNVEHYQVRNLELTNFTDDDRNFATGSVRRGLTVAIEDIGVGEGYTITDLYIHTVRGENKKGNGGSGGIQLEVHGSQTPTRYRDVEIAHNTVRDTNRSGINMSTT